MMRKSEMQIGQFGQSRRMGNWPWQLFAALDLFSPFYDDDFRQTQPGLAPRLPGQRMHWDWKGQPYHSIPASLQRRRIVQHQGNSSG